MDGEPRNRFSSRELVRFLFAFSSAAAGLALVALLILVTLHGLYPRLFDPGLLGPLTYVLGLSAGASAALGVVHAAQRYPQHALVIMAVLAISVAIMGAHVFIINSPPKSACYNSERGVEGCVMDEVYYVPSAQTMLAGTPCAPYSDNCNLEHPFLSKAFIAAGIAIFGDTSFGWRFFQVLLGTASIPLLFGVCWTVTRRRDFSLLATFLFALDTLFFVHSSIAVIDVHAVFFALLAFLAYFSKVRLWGLNSKMLAGAALGLSGLSKETSIFFVLFLVSYELLRGGGSLRGRAVSAGEMVAFVALVFAGGLALYDRILAPSETLLTHLSFIFSYGASLKGNGWVDGLLGVPITPLHWFTYYSPIGYLITNVKVTTGDVTQSYVGIGYYGVTSKIETWLTFLWAPYLLYLVYRHWKARKGGPVVAAPPEEDSGDGRDYELALFGLMLLAWTFLPYLGLYLYGRVTYPYYAIQSVPAVAIGSAYLLTRSWFPRFMIPAVTAALVGWFFLFYPDKSFLPIWLRVLIGH